MRDQIDQIPHITLTGRAQAINVTARLLSIIIDVDGLLPRESSSITTSEPTNTWILGIMAQLWRILSLEEAQVGHSDTPFVCLGNFLGFLRACFTKFSETRSDFANVARSSLLLSQVLTSTLLVQTVSLLLPLQKLFCLSLFDLVYAGRLWKGLGRILDDCLLPSLLHVKDDTTKLQTFSQDLQVSYIRHLSIAVR